MGLLRQTAVAESGKPDLPRGEVAGPLFHDRQQISTRWIQAAHGKVSESVGL